MDEAKCLMFLKQNKHINLIKDHHHLSTTIPMKKHHHGGGGCGGDDGGGGCIWPPRSYACSFCKRVFKSAQALGGHMNVHRRDRALLKQQVISNNNNNRDNNNNNNSHGNNESNINNNNNKSINSYNNDSFILNSKPLKYNNDRFSKNSNNRSMIVGQNNSYNSYVTRAPKKSYVSHITSSNNNNNNVPSKFAQSSRDNYFIKENSRGERDDSNNGYLSYKKFKKNGGYVALLPSFLDDRIKNSSFDKSDVGVVSKILSLKGSKSVDGLDLELRLGNSPRNNIT